MPGVGEDVLGDDGSVGKGDGFDGVELQETTRRTFQPGEGTNKKRIDTYESGQSPNGSRSNSRSFVSKESDDEGDQSIQLGFVGEVA